MKNHFLHAPVQNFGDVKLVFRGACNLVDPAKLLELFPGFAEHAQDFSVETHFVHAPGVSIGAVKELPRTRRNAESPGRTGRRGAPHVFRRLVANRRTRVRIEWDIDSHLALKVPFSVEYLNPPIAAITDVDVTLGIGCNRM